MSSADISGYLQISIGLVGIVLTVANANRLIPDVTYFVRGKGVPPSLDNVTGFSRFLVVLTILMLMMFLIGLGLSVTLSTLYRSLGSHYPLLSSFMTTAAIVSLSTTLSLAVYSSSFWIAGVVGTIGITIEAVISSVNPDIQPFWVTGGIFLGIFFLTGLGVLISKIT